MDKKPNILIIMCDQLRHDYLHCYGNEWISTPNIDSIAEDGCLYENAYSPNPVCIPARHNLFTGLTAREHGFDDNYFGNDARPCPWNLPTFAKILSDGGYSTFAFGKMHFQPERNAYGFDTFLNMDEVVEDIMEDEYLQFLNEKGYGHVGSFHGVRNVLYQQPQQSLLPDELHGSHWVADKTIEMLNKRPKQDRPFLCVTGFIQPHPPLSSPPSYSHLYDGKVPKHTSSITPLSTFAKENQALADMSDEANINRMRELYASAITWVDYNVGRILKALKDNELEDNTLVIFLSDHGEMLGDLDTYQKFLSYEASSHIPLLMKWPSRISKGTRNSLYADLNDILPTVVDVAGLEYPIDRKLPGESLFKEGQKDRHFQYIEHQRDNKRWCAILDGTYKLTHYYGDDDTLFNLKEDKEERINLLYNNAKEYQDIYQELRKKLIEYEKEWGLEGYIENDDFKKFARYEAHDYYEGCFPKYIKTYRGEEDIFDDLSDEIFKAIKDEPTVHLSKLHLKEILLNAGYDEEYITKLLDRARKEDRY